MHAEVFAAFAAFDGMAGASRSQQQVTKCYSLPWDRLHGSGLTQTHLFFSPSPVRHVWLPDVKQKRRRNRKLNINSNEAFERNKRQIENFACRLSDQLSVCLSVSFWTVLHCSTPPHFKLTHKLLHKLHLTHLTLRLLISVHTQQFPSQFLPSLKQPNLTTKQNNAAAEQVTNKSKAPQPTSASIYSWPRSQTTGDCVTLLEAQGAAVRHCLLPAQPMIQPQAQPQPQGLTGGSHHHHHPGSRGQTRYSRTNSGGGATYQTVFLV